MTSTIRDVAERANVSISTVSRVLNNSAGVSVSLRERVLEAVDSLGYTPDRSARRLRSADSDVIGLLISDIQNPFYLSVIRGIEDTLSSHHKSLLLCNTDEDLAKQLMYLDVMEAERVAGIIVVPSNKGEGERLRMIHDSGIPVILIDRLISGYEFDAVIIDNQKSAYQAVTHLIEQGYHRIAVIGGQLTIMTTQERLKGYRSAMEDAGLELDEHCIKLGDFRKPDDAFQYTTELMTLACPPDAIFVMNNAMLVGVLQAIRKLGKQIPDDVALLSFDDAYWYTLVEPPVTGVAQPTYDIGRESAQLLLRRLSEPEMPIRTLTLPTKLMIRESCGAGQRER